MCFVCRDSVCFLHRPCVSVEKDQFDNFQWNAQQIRAHSQWKIYGCAHIAESSESRVLEIRLDWLSRDKRRGFSLMKRHPSTNSVLVLVGAL